MDLINPESPPPGDASASLPDPPVPACLAGGGEMGALMRALDWSKTQLGAPETWPQSLRTSISICLDCHFPIVLWWGPELIVLYNDDYRPMLGGKHPASLGQRGRECWPEIWHIVGPMLDGVLSGGEATRSEDLLLLLESNGYPEERYFSFSYSPIQDETGSVGGVFTPVKETTEKVIGERRLRTVLDLAARARGARDFDRACRLAAETIAENPFDLPFALLYRIAPEADRVRLAASAGIAAERAASPAEIPLRRDGDGAIWPLSEVLRTGSAVGVEELGKRFGDLPAGGWTVPPEAARLIPITRPGQSEPAAILVAGLNPHKRLDRDYRAFLDLVATQIGAALADAQAYEEERRRADALAEIDRAKTTFFSNVSHEFRTPLTLLLGPIEDALADPSLPGVHRERLETVHRNSLRLLRLVNTLLDFSRVEAGRLRAIYQPVDLALLTGELASLFRSACEKAGLSLAVETPSLSEPVHVDREMWEKIVLNLLSNAFKFTFDGEIRVSLGVEGNCAVLRVADTGTGIPEAELPRLFERFHRIEGARGRTHEGTGIGLALVQELVRLHQGSIEVASTVGSGSTFTVRVPLGSSHLPPDRIGAPAPQSGPPQSVTAPRADAFVGEALRWLPDIAGLAEEPAAEPVAAGAADRPRVLVADDNADMREYLARLLRARYEVTAVGNGAEALAAIGSNRPDLVLSDIMMPVMDGTKLLERLRADPATRDIPVILLSARAGEEARIAGLRIGADDYLTKPFSARELLARVAGNIELARGRAQAASVLREEARRLEILNRVAGVLAAETDLEALVQSVTDAATELTGAAFGAFFYNVTDENGGAYLPYTLSGASREAFAGIPNPRNTAVFAPTFSGEGIVRSGDIRQDPRYGRNAPNKGPPPGHLPVVSYLAVPVVAPNGDSGGDSGGEVIGGIFLGHPEPDRFTAQHEAIAAGIAKQAAVAFEKARLYEASRRSEQAYRELNRTLEQRVAERTAERDRLWRNSQDVHLITGLDGVIRAVSPAAERLLGWSPQEMIGHPVFDFVIAADREGTRDAVRDAGRRPLPAYENRYRHKDGNYRWMSWVAAPEGGAIYASGRDITAEKRNAEALAKAEEALRQAQKIEAIGRLTGGIAHDFNNIMQSIAGTLELICVGSDDRERVRRWAEVGLRAAERGARLTGQLLAFSRTQKLEAKPLLPSAVISGMRELLDGTLGPAIRLRFDLRADGVGALADEVQLEMAILNLAINARDAMPEGGDLIIATRPVRVDGDPDLPQGDYVELSVADTGTGMTPDVASRAFDPFFTTKGVGKGTGLGLSQVYGMMRQVGGAACIESRPGHGTVVRLLLRATEAPAATLAHATPPTETDGRRATVLIVDDDPDVRCFMADALTSLGYAPIEAADGEAGIAALERALPDLVIVDYAMPGMTGAEVARAARARRRDLPIVFATGFAETAAIETVLGRNTAVLKKPFRIRDLQDALDAALSDRVRS